MSHGPTDEQVLAVLSQHTVTTSPGVVAEATGETFDHAGRALARLVRHGKAIRVSDEYGLRGWRPAPTSRAIRDRFTSGENA